MVTRGARRLGKTIRILSNSVELSSKESMAKEDERKYKERIRRLRNSNYDSPIQSLCGPFRDEKETSDT